MEMLTTFERNVHQLSYFINGAAALDELDDPAVIVLHQCRGTVEQFTVGKVAKYAPFSA